MTKEEFLSIVESHYSEFRCNSKQKSPALFSQGSDYQVEIRVLEPITSQSIILYQNTTN